MSFAPSSSTLTSTSPHNNTKAAPLVLPPHRSFPAFYTLQPNLTTRASQLSTWTTLLLSYAAHYRIFRISTSHPVFHNKSLNRRMAPEDAKVLFAHMVAASRAEWLAPATPAAAKSTWYGGGFGASASDEAPVAADEVYLYWRSPEDWFADISDWVDSTGQRNTVLTVWELVEGEAAAGRAWEGMPGEMFKRCLGVGVQRGRAVLFGEEEGLGVKFV